MKTRWYAGEEGEEQTDKNGNKFYEFGLIKVLKIKEKILDRHRIYVYPDDKWEVEKQIMVRLKLLK